MLSEDLYPQLVSAALFAVTSALVAYAVMRTRSRTTRAAALLSLFTVAGASYFMMVAYAGEAPLDLERAGPIKRWMKSAQERGYFEYEDTEAGEAAATAASTTSGRIRTAMFGTPEQREHPGAILKDCPHCPEMVIVQPAYFRMGATADDIDATDSERPSRLVRIGKEFAIGRHEVTVGQFAAYLQATKRSQPNCTAPRDTADPRLPMTCVSWSDAISYTSWLSETTGLTYRLPSEAQWEHAARAGSSGRYTSGPQLAPEIAVIERSNARPRPVGSGRPNAFGLFDVHGNAAEIAGDCWVDSVAKLPADGSMAVGGAACRLVALRDAHAGEIVTAVRVSARRPIGANERHPGVGFRVMRELK